MRAIEYVVRCTFDTPARRDAFERWLVEGHLRDVCEAGALGARLLRLDGEPLTIEARYRFASQDAFASYERDHAPRLRGEGRALFPEGVSYARSIAEVLHEERT
jgi:hypothetical protein